jgi:YD repeat-containing protein
LQVKKLALPNSAYITNTYDSVARLLSTELDNSGNTILNAHVYGYNVGNQRTNQTFLNNNYENYTYDNIGQLTSALGKESGGTTNRLQEQLKYAYDAAHNLNIRTNNALVQTFNVNDLNELSNVTRTGTLTVRGRWAKAVRRAILSVLPSPAAALPPCMTTGPGRVRT